jgi:predicted  nucleic acid-binding Zn-ribbon protein
VRHLQNCQKTLNEEVVELKKKLAERDRRLSDLESRVFFEMAELRNMI